MNLDLARNRKEHRLHNNTLLRRLAPNLATLESSKGSMRSELKRAGCDDTFLTHLLAQFSKSQMQ